MLSSRLWHHGLLVTGALFLATGNNLAMAESYDDPFVYCAAVGSLDKLDRRYVGPGMPLAIAYGLQKAFGLPADSALETFVEGAVWRCLEGKVYACHQGANIPCYAKANISRVANTDMIAFCRETPDSDYIPFAITGRTTIYDWRCANGAPQIVKEFVKPDARGFLTHIWHEIQPE